MWCNVKKAIAFINVIFTIKSFIGGVSDDSNQSDRDKIIEDVLRIYLRHNLTFVCLQAIFGLLNRTPGTKYQYPTSKYSILKHMNENNNIQTTYHVQCSKCKKYIPGDRTEEEMNCSSCLNKLKRKETNFFITFGAIEQLKTDIMSNWETIKTYYSSNNMASPYCGVKDCYDGRIFKNIFQYSSKSTFVLPLGINTDGVNVFKSDPVSVWPILLTQNYLPPDIRFKREHTILAGLYYGKSKPDMKIFFEPIIKEFEGEYLFFGEHRIQLEILLCTVDLQAKAPLQQIKQYNGEFACTYCLHPGVKFVQPNNHTIVRYGNTSTQIDRRTNLSTLKTMEKVSKLTKKKKNEDLSIDGVKGLSPLVALPNFDIIDGFGIDYMHNILLGVVKTLLNFWFEPGYKHCYINPKQAALLDERILSIKACSFIKRKPRSLSKRDQFKASELRSLLLYFLPVSLRGILRLEFYEHFMKLSMSVYVLLKKDISDDELEEVEDVLKEFVLEYEQLYGSENVVMNTHLVQHLVHSVRNHGPLWTHSAFHFEDFNGVITKFVKGTTDVLLQVSSKYLLLKKLQLNTSNDFIATFELLGKSVKINVDESDSKALSNKKIRLVENWMFVYKRLLKSKRTFTSIAYSKAKKTVDYFVSFTNGSLGIIKYYFKIEDIIYVMVEQYGVRRMVGHIREMQALNQNIVMNAKNIVTKYIYMKIEGRHWLVNEPNEFERD